MSRLSRTSGHWRHRQGRDAYVSRAAREGWRSRSVYKLEQIDARARLFGKGMVCVDLGACPGGWSQYAAAKIGSSGRVLAVDLKPMDPQEAAEFLAQGGMEAVTEKKEDED